LIDKLKVNGPAALHTYPEQQPYASPLGQRRCLAVPDHIERYYIPLSVLEATDRVMRSYGREQRECYVWWSGYFTAQSEGQVVSAIFPDMKTDFGRVYVDFKTMQLLSSELRKRDQVLLIELHTHPPGAGGQNPVDAAHPATVYPGFISIVVPNFGFPKLYDLRETYVYRYIGNGAWIELKAEEIEEWFAVEEPLITIRIR